MALYYRAVTESRANRLFFLAWGCVGFLCLLGLWQIAVLASPRISVALPPPSALPSAFATELSLGILLPALGSTLLHLAGGITLGTCLGIICGYFIAVSPLVRALINPIVILARPIPALAWIPMAIVWFGISSWTALFIVAQGVFWTMLIATQGAIENIHREHQELAYAYGFTSFHQQLVHFIAPDAAPAVMTAFRSALGQSWTLIVAAELCGIQGLGQRLWEVGGMLATDRVGAYMLLIGGAAACIDLLFRGIESRVLFWRQPLDSNQKI